MKRRISLLILAVVGVMAISLLWVMPAMKGSVRKAQQEELAKSLGVRIEAYPYPADFPAGYFYKVLKPGMTYDEVHSMVRGYKLVYRCFGMDEVYLYFNEKSDDALLFALHYDQQGRYIELQGDDPNSRTLSIGPGCDAGLLGRR
jgi:hypothetical protein